MKAKFAGLVVAALLTISALGAASASAATEFGDNCVADEATFEPPITLFDISAPGNPLPLTAPVSGVITQWKSNLAPVPAFVPQTLKVLRQNGPNTVQVIGESSGTITGGPNTFNARISVQAGDRLGLFGDGTTYGNLFCNTPGVENLIGAFAGGGPGATVAFAQFPEKFRIPAFAVIEPDADNDGFGDETQDKCPQNASFQVPCPVAKLSASAIVKKGLVTVLVTSDVQASVNVAGKIRLGKGKTAKLNGGTQIVVPGTISKFTMLFRGNLKAKLKELSRKRSLTLNITATAPNPVGAPSTRKLKAKLRGQKKPAGKSKRKGGKRPSSR
ncbi:MAG TPA: hypothetical protein VNO20_11245 [Solirubrobacterales bacterium]|nr:hypothetical protein [Solirubrobacterales bacterium]